jgi:DNA-binding NarL/FixJ family response regulator
MAVTRSTRRQRLDLILPAEWSELLRAKPEGGARASIQFGDATPRFEIAASLEVVDDRRVAIELAMVNAPTADRPPHSPAALLTDRERSVIALIADGLETPEIAERLFISPATVRTHVRNAMGKVGARTRAQLAVLATRAEVLPPPSDDAAFESEE